jgi:hypothetical protein
MNWLATLRRSGGINAIAHHLGMSPIDAGAGIAALVPALIAGLRDYCAKSGGGDAGLRALVAFLNELDGGDLAAQVMGQDPLRIEAGNTLLDRLFGESRTETVDNAERSTDVARDVLDELLPPLAMLVGGYIAARVTGSGAGGIAHPSGLEELLGTLLTYEDERSSPRHKGEGPRS